MATDITTSGFDHGSAASLDDLSAFTYMLWVKLDATSNCGIMAKGTSGGASRRSVEIQSGSIYTVVDGSSTDHDATSVTAIVGTGSWKCYATTWAGGDNAPKIYNGDLTTILAESSYLSQNAGSGAPSSNAANNMYVGAYGAGTGPTNGVIAFAMVCNAALSLVELQQQQFRPFVRSDTVLFTFPGFGDGTDVATDLSGLGNDGSSSGNSFAANPPLVNPFEAAIWEVSTSAAAAGAILGGLAGSGGLAGPSGLAGLGGGLAG